MARITKYDNICFVLSHADVPLTRIEVMRVVHALEGKKTAFSPTSNVCYWRPKRSEDRRSVLVKGLVAKAGRTRKGITYRLTQEGMERLRRLSPGDGTALASKSK